MLKINTISRPVFFVRDNKTIETNNTGEYITEAEFATLVSDGEVICVDETTGQRFTYTPGAPVVYTTAPEPVVEPVVESTTPATDAGRVPSDISTGSEKTKA
jgi:Flp pilus assembly protein TadG